MCTKLRRRRRSCVLITSEKVTELDSFHERVAAKISSVVVIVAIVVQLQTARNSKHARTRTRKGS